MERYCPRCGGHNNLSDGFCQHCGMDRTKFERMVESGSDDVLWVGGVGIGAGGAYSDIFHALNDERTRSLCGRLEAIDHTAPDKGLSWATPLLTLEGARRWQSEPCGHCMNMGGFDVIDRDVHEVEP